MDLEQELTFYTKFNGLFNPSWSVLRRRGNITFKEIADLVQVDFPVILEIGANDGTDTIEFSNAFPNGSIYCFEPDPRAANDWRKNVLKSNAQLFEMAISNKNGVLEFHQSDFRKGSSTQQWHFSGSTRKPKHHLERYKNIVFEKTIQVKSGKLDDWCEEHGIYKIDFLWADVQGAEGDLIEGAGEILRTTKYFYTEYSNKEMYDGQWGLKKIAQSLPNHKLIKVWKHDALFKLN